MEDKEDKLIVLIYVAYVVVSVALFLSSYVLFNETPGDFMLMIEVLWTMFFVGISFYRINSVYNEKLKKLRELRRSRHLVYNERIKKLKKIRRLRHEAGITQDSEDDW